MTVQFRNDAQITANYTPDDLRRIAEWAHDSICHVMALPTEERRRQAFDGLLSKAPYLHVRECIREAAVEIMLQRGLR